VGTPRLASVRLAGCDGGPLRVDVRSGARPGDRRPAIVICHGFKGFKDWGFFPLAADRLALAGFTAVSFNFSGSGVGEDGQTFDELERWGRQTVTGDLADLAKVLDYVAAEGAAWIGLLGHSRGGGTAVIEAARDGRVRALVTWAAVCRYLWWSEDEIERWRRDGRLDVVNLRTGEVLPVFRNLLDDLEANEKGPLSILDAAARVAVPWLIVHGSDDESVPTAEGRTLLEASRSGTGRAELMLVEGTGHTFGARHPWAGSTPELDRVLSRTVEFFSAALG
jgi:dipeptidyl aminopeptidase/acylaminoacyl peptidase